MAKKRRRSAFVPRIIFGTMFVGVVPAVANCGGDDTSSGGQSGTTIKGVAAGGFSVAGVGFGGFAGVGVGGFAGVAAGGFGGVAAAGFGGSGGSGSRDAGTDVADGAGARGGAGGAVQDSGRRDAPVFGVAAGGFGVAQAAFGVPPSQANGSNR